MSLIKFPLCLIPTSIALSLWAILPQMAIATQSFSSPSTTLRSPLVPLKKGESEPFLAPLGKGGWGGQTTQLAQVGPPPPRKNPGSSSAGGRRDPTACPQDAATATPRLELTALSPTTKPGLTVAERPTFLVYIPKTSAKTAEFSLRDPNEDEVYQTTFALTHTADIVSITLPSQIPPLEIGKPYTWSVAIICNPNDRLNDRFVTGTVQRTELNPDRLRQIQQASPRERVALYQQADAWYDALAILFELRRTQPNDSAIKALWREFLQSSGVDIEMNSQSK